MRSQGSKLRIAQLAVVQDEPKCGKRQVGMTGECKYRCQEGTAEVFKACLRVGPIEKTNTDLLGSLPYSEELGAAALRGFLSTALCQ